MINFFKNFFNSSSPEEQVNRLLKVAENYKKIIDKATEVTMLYAEVVRDLETMLRLYIDFRKKYDEDTLTHEDLEYHNIVIQSLNVRQRFRKGNTGDTQQKK